MEKLFSKTNIIEIVCGIILSIVAMELLVALPFFEDIPQGVRIIVATSLQAIAWMSIIRVSLGEKFSWQAIYFLKTSRTWVLVAFLLGLFCTLRIFILGPLSLLPFFQNGLEALETTLQVSTTWEYILFATSTIIIAPIIEEIIFRGFIYRILRNRRGPVFAILVSAVIFGAIHIIPLYALNAFLIGIPLAWLYEKSRSLVPGIVMHMANNALFFILMIVLPDVF